MRTRSERKTVNLCSLADDSCKDKLSWALESVDSGQKLQVCDTHLANAIRTLGTPARVEPFKGA